MNENSLKTLLSVIPIFTGFLYVIGSMYLGGYLLAYNLDGSQFQASVDRTLFSGFVVLLLNGWAPWMMLFVAIFVCWFVVSLCRVIVFSRPEFRKWLKEREARAEANRLKNSDGVEGKALEDFLYRSYVWAGGSLLVLLTIFFSAFLSREAGVMHARSEIEDFRNDKGNYVLVETDMLNGKGSTKALQLICGSTSCAYWLGDRSIILKFEQIKSLNAYNPSTLKALPRQPYQRS